MKFGYRRLAPLLLLAALTPVAAQDNWQPWASVSPVYVGKSDIDGGGDYSSWGALVRAGIDGGFGAGHRVGVTLTYDYLDYSFNNPAAFGGVAPWGAVRRYGVSVPLGFNMGNGWLLGVAPSVDWIHETGADQGESLEYGALLTAMRVYANGNRLGLGVGVFSRLEETSVIPLLLIDWQISDRWRLVNPLPAGPTGGAGLELDYRFDNGWNVGLGAAYRTLRFRLSETGPVPDGIGEERGVPVFLRASTDLAKGVALRLYAGVVTGAELRVETPSGDSLRKVDADPSLLLGLTISARH
jgi:hypothetical protein